MKTLLIAALVGITALAAAPQAEANSLEGAAWDAKERFMIRARAIAVMPDEDGSANIPGGPDIGERVVPEVDFSYFFTDNIAAELIVATANHDVDWNSLGGNTNLGDVWLLPPTLTLQYHFMPHTQFKPYVGAGLNYTIFYGEDKGAANSIEYDDGFGYALQAGFDVMFTENWGWNFDVKKLWLDTDVSINGGAINANVDIDPWIVGTGVTYRF